MSIPDELRCKCPNCTGTHGAKLYSYTEYLEAFAPNPVEPPQLPKPKKKKE